MTRPTTQSFQQVSIRPEAGSHQFVQQCHIEESAHIQEQEKFEENLLQRCPAYLWPGNSYQKACPRPILITKKHQKQLEELHEALTLAITDIVERWWIDQDAHFSDRMPLEPQEEQLLRWIETQIINNKFPIYRECRGSWRPDFLVEDVLGENGIAVENYRITEINARFSFNGFLHSILAYEALEDMGAGKNGLRCAANPRKLLDGAISLFQTGVPLHLLKGKEPGMDIHMLLHTIEQRFGFRPRIITPAQLRLFPSDDGSGYKLCCLVGEYEKISPFAWQTNVGEFVEEIYQLGLELHQSELLALEPEMLRQISLHCFNDLRSIFLTHDKRMLGILKQELNSLVTRCVITGAQAKILDQGIADTYLPGSKELERLFCLAEQFPDLRKEFILKPIRSGKGAGIVFGEEFTAEDWISALQLQRSTQIIPGVTCVVQRRITPRLYGLVLSSSGVCVQVQNPLVGTYFVVHGRLLGLGLWRSSPDKICAISNGGAWVCSVISQDEL
ncbi:hypothetical protein BCIN_03g00090 [Botrytis cinerea B05.10]|uniref:Taurine catabolism dioxygenase protein n=1 Tax=Botryotinia fuckeliana (strain B05.10) TaxID=332648 RepID=A0A384JB94_BOTFB|nr:hypothetical protein BCIN_03g00090 [Botrytis cinerea B05.10]ATZ47697.1 hypothetical protein BCIN_03g00090 [Botrytis cinerea B05.10]